MNIVTKEEYWPAILADPQQADNITTDDAEWNKRAACIFAVLKDTLCTSTTAILVRKWEKNLGITPEEGASISDRKVAILNLMNGGLPCPESLLEKAMERILGEGNFSITKDTEAQKMTVSLAYATTREQIEALKALLGRVVPKETETDMEWEGGLPLTYTRLDYLEATGEQYINAGVPLSSELDLLVDFAPVFTGSAHVLFGTRRNDLGTNRGTYAQIMPTAGQIVVWRHTRRMLLQGVQQARHTLELTGTSLVLDGAVKSTYTEEPWEYTQPCYLGAAINHAGVVQLPLVGLLYGFTLKQSGSKKLNLIPALDPTGAPCMFDTVSRTPYYNSGTGDFIYPNMETQATTYSLRRRDYAQMTEHGIRRLYHVPKDSTQSKEEYAERNGFKILIETPAPEEGYWEPRWHEREDCIELEWVETEPSTEEETINS